MEAFLERKLGAPLKIGEARRLTGGASRDTWLVEADLGGERAGLVVRLDMGGEITPDALSRDSEFRVLRRAFDSGILVPRPRWSFASEAEMPAFLVVDRLEGESVGSRVVRSPALAEARKALPAQLGEQLAKIHALPFDDLDFLPRPAGVAPAAKAVKDLAEQLLALGEPHPVLELAIRRLAAHAPPCGRLVLLHGDYRVGNLMVGPGGLVGIFDWEFAHVGDPAEDLAWPCVRAWRFGRDDLEFGGVGRPEEFFDAYESAGGARVDREAIRFWEMVGNLRWAVGCVAQAHRHLSGQAVSVELASLGRRACEMELELLDLMDRAGW